MHDDTPRRDRSSSTRAGWLLLSALVAVGLLLSTLSFVTESAKPRRDRTPHGRVTAHKPVEARLAHPARRYRGVQGEIVGGTVVPQGTYPFAAALRINVGDNLFTSCTGSLIDPTHVLTAGHCVEDDGALLAPPQFTVTIGRASRVNPPLENVFTVADVALHPDYQPFPGSKNDVAVLTLSEAVPDFIAQPIAIVGDTRFDLPGQPVIAAGWGRTVGGDENPTSPDLMETGLRVISDTDCEAFFSGEQDDASIFCAEFPDTVTCQGDSGGPLFVTAEAAAKAQAREKSTKDEAKTERKKKRRPTPTPVPPPPLPPTTATQIGVTSFGAPNCPPGTPAGFAQLSDPGIAAFIASARAT